jgi:hypothetical protein
LSFSLQGCREALKCVQVWLERFCQQHCLLGSPYLFSKVRILCVQVYLVSLELLSHIVRQHKNCYKLFSGSVCRCNVTFMMLAKRHRWHGWYVRDSLNLRVGHPVTSRVTLFDLTPSSCTTKLSTALFYHERSACFENGLDIHFLCSACNVWPGSGGGMHDAAHSDTATNWFDGWHSKNTLVNTCAAIGLPSPCLICAFCLAGSLARGHSAEFSSMSNA